jgi:HEAT repeat protein
MGLNSHRSALAPEGDGALELSLEAAIAAATAGDWRAVVAHLEPLASEPADRWPAIAVDLAVAAATGDDGAARRTAAAWLPALGEAARDRLGEIICDPIAAFGQRWQAGRLLGQLLGQLPGAAAQLTALLTSGEDEELTGILAGAIASAGAEAIAGLAMALDRTETRSAAAAALAKICHPAIVEPLLAVAADPDPAVRAIALEALANFVGDRDGARSAQIVAILETALTDPATVVRRAAVDGLATQGARDAFGATALLRALVPRLGDLDFVTCERAAQAIARLKTPEAAQAIAAVLHRPTTPLPLQLALVPCLLWTETPEAIAAIEPLLAAPVAPELRLATVRHLGRIQAPALKGTAAQAIARHCTPQTASDLDFDLDLGLKQAIATAAGQLGDPSLRPLLEQLGRDRDQRVSLQAIASLRLLAPLP